MSVSDGEHPIDTTVDVKEPGGETAPLQAQAEEVPPGARLIVDEEVPPGARLIPDPPTADEVHQDNADEFDWQAKNDKAEPAKRAVSLRAAKTFDLPLSSAENTPDLPHPGDFRPDWSAVSRDTPGLTSYLRQNMPAVPLAKDDLGNLSRLEFWLGKPRPDGDFAQKFFSYSPLDQVARGPENMPGYVQAFVDALKHEHTVLKEMVAANVTTGEQHLQNTERYGKIPDSVRPELLAEANARAAKEQDAAQAEVDASAAAYPEKPLEAYGAGGFPENAVATASKIGPFLLGNAAAEATLGPAGVVMYNYYEARGPLDQRLKAVRDANGQPLDPKVIEVAGNTGAIGVGVVFSGGVGKLIGATPVAKGVAEKLTGDVLAKAFAERTTGTVVKQGMQRFGDAWGTGALLMGISTGINAGSVEAAKAYSGQPGLEGNLVSVVNESADATAEALKTMWLISIAGPARETIAERGRLVESAQASTRLKMAIDAAEQSKFLEHTNNSGDTTPFSDAVSKMAPGAQVAVPVEAWNKYWQAARVDPGEAARHITGSDRAYFETQTGGDLVLPAAEFLAKLGKTDHLKGLALDTRLSSAQYTPREQVEFSDRLVARLEQAAKANKVDEGKGEVFDFIYQAAVESKASKAEARQVAKLAASSVETWAKTNGITAQAAAAAGGFGRLSFTGPGGKAIAEKATAEFRRRIAVPDDVTKLMGRLESIKDPTKLAETMATEDYLDSKTGALNSRAIDETPVPEGKSVAIITTPAVKPVNDHSTAGGHNAGNEMLKAMTVSAGAGHEEAARTATNTRIFVDTDKADEQLKQAIARTQAQLGPGVDVVGAHGATTDEAFAKLRTETDRRRGLKAGQPEVLPARGELQPGVDVAKLDYSKVAKAQAKVPAELAAKSAAKNHAEHFEQTYVDKVRGPDGKPVATGLMSAKAFEILHEMDPKAHTLAIDGSGVGLANKLGEKLGIGNALGDKLIHILGRSMNEVGGTSVRAAHLSGDEFAATHDDPAVLEKYAARIGPRAKELASALKFGFPLNGEFHPLDVEFRHGLGIDYDSADRALNAKRRLEQGAQGTGGVSAVAGGRAGAAGNDQVAEHRTGPEAVRGNAEAAAGGRVPTPATSPEEVAAILGRTVAQPFALPAAHVVAHIEGRPVTVRMDQAGRTRAEQIASPEFKAWFKDSKVVDPTGQPLVVFHGSQRPDRVGDKFLKSRATSGPSAFFTDDPEIGSNYSTNKRDTSLERPADYSEWFKMKTGRSTSADLDQAWHHLSGAQRAEIAAKLPHVDLVDETGSAHDGQYRLGDEKTFGLAGGDHWAYEIKAAGGNVLKAAKEIWLNGGSLVDSEHEFMKVLELGGAKGLFDFHDPNASSPAVYPVHLSIQKPLETSAIGPEVISALERAAKRQPEPKDTSGADQWDKRVQSPGTWLQRFKDDLASGTNSHAWTSIPDWVTKTLKGLGYDGIHDTGGKMGGREHSVWVPFEPTQIKSATGNKGTFDSTKKSILAAGDPKAPRGFIAVSVDPNGKPRDFAISALNGDKSTFVHEMSHFLSWSMHDLAESAVAGDQLKADYKALIKWAGFKDPMARIQAFKNSNAAQQNAQTDDEKKKALALNANEEKISHAFEQYLLEGKAPSAALARSFATWRGWLMNIYKGVEGIQNQYAQNYGEPLHLSDEVRGIFNRLLTQDQALEKAAADVGADVKGPDETKGMTQAQKVAYAKALLDKKTRGQEMLARALPEFPNVIEARRRIAKEVAEKLDQQQVYRAQAALQALEPAEGEQSPKLERKAFVKQFGKEAADLMPRGIFAKAGEGHPADQVAPLVGYDTGQEMVDAFKRVEPRDKALARETQARVDEELKGDPGFGMAKEALEAEHNEFGLAAAVMRMRGIAEQVNPAAARRAHAVDPRLLHENSERIISQKPVDQLEPRFYANTEKKLALEAARQWAKDKETSAALNEQAALNRALFMAARDAKAELDRAEHSITGISEEMHAALGKADPLYRDAHDSLAAAVGLGGGGIDAPRFEEMVAKATADGYAQNLDFDAGEVRKLLANPVDWNKLTVEQARNVADAIACIRHVARETHTVVVDGKRQERQEFVQKVTDRVASVQKAKPNLALSTKSEKAIDKLKKGVTAAQAQLEDHETWAEMMDGGTSGPMHDLLINDRLKSRDTEVRLTKQVLEGVKKALADMPKEVKALRTQQLPAEVTALLPSPTDYIDAPKARHELWMLFLNWGNEGNRQRIIDGNKWSAENVQKALNELKPSETKLLQSVLDSIQGLYPELAALHEKQTGVKLGDVGATPITVNGETFRGGYFPLKYDERQSGTGARQEITSAKDLQPNVGERVSLQGSYRKGRVDRVENAPVAMDFGILNAHLSKVIRDISYGDWVRQTGTIFLDQNFKAIVRQYLGEGRLQEFMPWLSDTALQRAESTAGFQSKTLGWAGSFARGVVARNVMGLNVAAFGRHLWDPYSAMADSDGINPLRIARAYTKVLGSWNKPLYEESREIAYHHAARTDNLRREIARIAGTTKLGGAMEKYNDTLFAAQRVVDHFTTRVGFQAGYDDGIARGMSHEEAVQRGDDILRRHFQSGDIASLSPIQRSRRGIGAALVFYGYANRMYNVNARAFDKMVRAFYGPNATFSSKSKAVAAFAGAMLAVGGIEAIGSYFAGRGPKKDEDALEWAGLEAVLAPVDKVPIIGAPTKAVLLGHKVNIASAPELTLLDQVFKRIGSHAVEQPEDEDALWSGISEVTSLIAPTGTVNKSGKYLSKLRSGEAQPRGPLDVGGGLLYGPKAGESHNPFTDAQDAISGE